MKDVTLQLRTEDKLASYKAILIILVSVLAHIAWFSCSKSCVEFFWQSWAMIWLPVMLAYLVMPFFLPKIRLTFIQIISAFFVSNAINFFIAYIFVDQELLLFYVFLFFPGQILLIVFMEILKSTVKRFGRLLGWS